MYNGIQKIDEIINDIENNWKEKDYIFQGEKTPMLTYGTPLISEYPNNYRIKLETELN